MLIMLALLSVWPRWPPSPAGIGVGSAVSGEELDSNRAATSRLQTHRNEWNRWDSDCGGRNILWGTQQGHLPGAMWWLRRFYTVAFVCLFRLGSLPGGAAGQPSVVIYLISSFTTLSLLSLIPIFSSCFFFAVAVPEICRCHCERRLTFDSGCHFYRWILGQTDFDFWTFIPHFLCPCLRLDRSYNSPCRRGRWSEWEDPTRTNFIA